MAPVSARADACAAVEREMVRGAVALEDAKDRAGFLQSAKQFEAATGKVPNCPKAHFNLGLVYEKAGEYGKAASSLKTYLKLAPKAQDATAVQRKIYALEYRAEQLAAKAETPKREPESKWVKLNGTWCEVGVNCGSRTRTQHWDQTFKTYSVTVTGTQIKVFHDGAAYNTSFRCKRFQRDTYEGTIDASGNIRGNWVHDWRFERHCAPFTPTPPNDATGSFTGRVTGRGTVIELRANGYAKLSRQQVGAKVNLVRHP